MCVFSKKAGKQTTGCGEKFLNSRQRTAEITVSSEIIPCSLAILSR